MSINTVNIVIPMAGKGSRFQVAGYDKPKPFIDVLGKPMVVRVAENLQVKNANFIFIARKEHVEAEPDTVREIEETYNAKFLAIDHVTEGTVCTVLYAREFINNDVPLLIANSDQIVDMDIKAYLSDCYDRKLDGSILTFIEESLNNKWSYAKIDQDGLVTEVKEKVAISDRATVGIYFFNKGSDFVDAAVDMIVHNDRCNNEFYTCPTYNYAIKNGLEIGTYDIERSQMHGLGIPEDLDRYVDWLNRESKVHQRLSR